MKEEGRDLGAYILPVIYGSTPETCLALMSLGSYLSTASGIRPVQISIWQVRLGGRLKVWTAIWGPAMYSCWRRAE